MSPSRRGSAGGKGRYVLVGVAALLVLLIGASFALSGQARSNAESEAELSAERSVVSGLSSVLTPDLVERDIRDRDYQDLLIDVQSGVMSDAHVVRVRIWKPDGDLIFSTAQLDDVEEFIAVDNTQIQQAAEGQTVSVVAGATEAPLAGLEGSDEQLLVTYVPLQFSEASPPDGVVEIDQRYSAILDEANGLWRPVQIGLGVALLGLGALFAVSQRRSKRREASRWSPKPAASRPTPGSSATPRIVRWPPIAPSSWPRSAWRRPRAARPSLRSSAIARPRPRPRRPGPSTRCSGSSSSTRRRSSAPPRRGPSQPRPKGGPRRRTPR